MSIRFMWSALLLLVVMLVSQRAWAETYIKEIAISTSTTEKTVIDYLENNGFTVLKKELNDQTKKSGEDWVYIGYKTTTKISEAITDILIVDGQSYLGGHMEGTNDPIKFGSDTRNWYSVPTGGSCDINNGAGKGTPYLSLYYTRDGNASKDGKPITGIDVLYNHNSTTSSYAKLFTGGAFKDDENAHTNYGTDSGTKSYIAFTTHTHAFTENESLRETATCCHGEISHYACNCGVTYTEEGEDKNSDNHEFKKGYTITRYEWAIDESHYADKDMYLTLNVKCNDCGYNITTFRLTTDKSFQYGYIEKTANIEAATCTTQEKNHWKAKITIGASEPEYMEKDIKQETADHTIGDNGVCSVCGRGVIFIKFISDDWYTGTFENWGAKILEYNRSHKGYRQMEFDGAVTNVPDNAFKGKWRLETCILPNSVKTIGTSAFSGCNNLKDFVIPTSVEEIKENAFERVYYFPSTIVVPGNVKKLGKNVFHNALHNGNEVSDTLILQEGVEVLDQTFCDGHPAHVLVIPASTKTFKGSVFVWGYGTIINYSLTPQTFERSSYRNRNQWATIKVPARAVAAYRNSSDWCNLDWVSGIKESVISEIDHEFVEINNDKYIKTKGSCLTGTVMYKACIGCGQKHDTDTWSLAPTTHSYDTNGLCTYTAEGIHGIAPTIGDGSMSSPYQLSKPGHLVWFSDKTNGLHGLERNMGACAVLTADIDMNAVSQFTPIALYSDTKSSGTYYTGQFNGQGHIIKNLHVYAPDTYEAGMFSRLRYAKVMNLIIENVDVSCSGGTHRAGGLAGLEWTDCVIRNCAVIGNISFTARDGGTLLDGGFLGIYATGTFDQCYTSYHRIDSEAHTTFVRSYYNVAADDARLASGELGYLMNGGVVNGTQGWYQNLGTNGDARPVPDSSHATIYRHTNCDGSGYTCSNSNADNAHTWGINNNGLCAVCKAAYQPCTGDGTDSNPYQITNAGNLIWFSNQQNTLAAGTAMNAKVMNDINLSGVWNTTIPSIGESVQYAHTFDGQNHTISNLTYRGLFCIVAAGGTVKNVVLDNPRATVDPNYQGSSKNYSANYQSPLVRRNYGTIQECIVKNGQWDTRSLYLGGITGVNETGAKILRCACYNFNFRSRHGVSTPVGGICAVQCEKALIEDCYTWSSGFTWFTAEQGAGIVHTNSSNATVNNCYSQYATPVYTNSGTTTDVTGSIVADDVIYGRLAYLLNHKKTDGKQAWYEMIADKAETMTDEETGKEVYKETGEEVVRDTFPHLVKDVEKRTVYEVDYTKCNGETVKIYRNVNKAIKQEHNYGTEGDSRFTCINDGCGYVDEDLKAKYSIKPGDVNADTFINIADITALVDIILGKADSTDTADVNGDTKVDIADVTALVNLLFGESQAADE